MRGVTNAWRRSLRLGRVGQGLSRRASLSLVLALCGIGLFGATSSASAKTSTTVAYVTDFGTGSDDPSGPGSGSSIFVNALTGTPPGGTYTTADGSKTVTHVFWTIEAAANCPSCDHRYDR